VRIFWWPWALIFLPLFLGGTAQMNPKAFQPFALSPPSVVPPLFPSPRHLPYEDKNALLRISRTVSFYIFFLFKGGFFFFFFSFFFLSFYMTFLTLVRSLFGAVREGWEFTSEIPWFSSRRLSFPPLLAQRKGPVPEVSLGPDKEAPVGVSPLS